MACFWKSRFSADDLDLKFKSMIGMDSVRSYEERGNTIDVDRPYQFLYFNPGQYCKRQNLRAKRLLLAGQQCIAGDFLLKEPIVTLQGLMQRHVYRCAASGVPLFAIRRPHQFLYATHDGGTRQMNKERIYGGDPFENFNDASKNDFFAVWEQESQNHYSGEIYVVILFFFHQCQTKRHLDDLCTFRFGYKSGQSSQ